VKSPEPSNVEGQDGKSGRAAPNPSSLKFVQIGRIWKNVSGESRQAS